MEYDLDELLGIDEAEVAREMLSASAEGLQSSVKQSISAYKRVFESKDEHERQLLKNDSQARSLIANVSIELSQLVDCPACSSTGLVTGREIRRSKPYYDQENLSQEVTCLSEAFVCYACELKLQGASHLQWSGIEPQFTVFAETSLHEQQEFEYYDEYMNE